jgi:hypothetical protein
MIWNLLDVLSPKKISATRSRHGLKHYLGPLLRLTPKKVFLPENSVSVEEQPRLDIDNFYYVLKMKSMPQLEMNLHVEHSPSTYSNWKSSWKT